MFCLELIKLFLNVCDLPDLLDLPDLPDYLKESFIY